MTHDPVRWLWAAVAAEHAVTLTLDSTGPVPASAAPGAVEQILDNLLDNAVGHAPPGSVVEIVLRLDGSDGVLRLVDHGPGMDGDGYQRLRCRNVPHADGAIVAAGRHPASVGADGTGTQGSPREGKGGHGDARLHFEEGQASLQAAVEETQAAHLVGSQEWNRACHGRGRAQGPSR